MERLEEENKQLKLENELLKERLNIYSTSYKKYYESNIEIINEKQKEIYESKKKCV